MELASSEEAVTYFLEHIVPTSDTGTDDETLRERTARFLQAVVSLYCEPPWKFKEQQDMVQFAGATGLADLPDDFGTWDRNWGWLVWGPPNTQYRTQINPTKCNPKHVLTLREQYPDREGVPEQVVMHKRVLKRWPTKPPGGAAETAAIFYHRRRFNILDLFGVDEQPEADEPQDEWPLIPVEDQEVLIELLQAKWEIGSGDGRQLQHDGMARRRVRELYKSKNQDQQPSRMSQPFSPGRMMVPRVGDRYQT